jgi:hypothetical protein
MRFLVLSAVLLLPACGGEGSDNCSPTVGNAEVRATIGTGEWASVDATWRLSGSSLQLNAASADGSALSFVLQATTDGESTDVATPPFTVDLGPEGGGWVVYYPDQGSSLSTNLANGSGTFQVAEKLDTLMGCFSGVLSDGSVDNQEFDGEINAVGAR